MANQTIVQGTTVHVGDTIDIHYKVIETAVVSGKTKREKHEEQKERTQVFEGVVLAIKGTNQNTMFTVRRIGAGAIGIERIFPIISPWIKKVDVKKRGKVRRAKLYHLRRQIGRNASRIKEKLSLDLPHVQAQVDPTPPTA